MTAIALMRGPFAARTVPKNEPKLVAVTPPAHRSPSDFATSLRPQDRHQFISASTHRLQAAAFVLASSVDRQGGNPRISQRSCQKKAPVT
jgi:hypothetical protein